MNESESNVAPTLNYFGYTREQACNGQSEDYGDHADNKFEQAHCFARSSGMNFAVDN